jgi:hypothetical protein
MLFSHAHKPERGIGERLQAVSTTQNRNGSGRWPKGVSGNPGGRPLSLGKGNKGVGRRGRDGTRSALVEHRPRTKPGVTPTGVKASRLLAERDSGKAPAFAAIEEGSSMPGR